MRQQAPGRLAAIALNLAYAQLERTVTDIGEAAVAAGEIPADAQFDAVNRCWLVNEIPAPVPAENDAPRSLKLVEETQI